MSGELVAERGRGAISRPTPVPRSIPNGPHRTRTRQRKLVRWPLEGPAELGTAPLPSHGRGPGFESSPVQGPTRQAAWGATFSPGALRPPRPRMAEPHGAHPQLGATRRRARCARSKSSRFHLSTTSCAVAPSGCHATRDSGASGWLVRRAMIEAGISGCAGLPSHGRPEAPRRVDLSRAPRAGIDRRPSPALPRGREDLGPAPVSRYGASGFQGADCPGCRRRSPRSAVGTAVHGGPPPTRYRPRRQAWLGRREQAEQRLGPRCRPPPPLKPLIEGTVGA